MIKEQNSSLVTDGVMGVATRKVKSALSGGRGTLALAIIGGAISTASSFMFCLVSIGFDFTQLATTSFWSRWASMFISTLVTYVLVVIHKDEVNRLKGAYVEELKKLRDFEHTDEFEEFLKEYNLARKIAWHKNHVNARIAKLKARRLKLELKNKPTVKVDGKIKTYEKLVEDEYIEQNMYTLKTKSKPISSAQVLTETKKMQTGEENFRSAGLYYGSKGLVKLCLSLLMTSAFASVVVENFSAGITVASIVMVLFTVLSMVLSTASALTAANGCYRNVYVPNLQFKLKILSAFNKWKSGANLGTTDEICA